ncbi:MAG: helix-turn-helix domain-containing protein [Eubacterium sp.]|nr:helix-turn-helix domain-containing protein [Eubacterium sp.]
MKLSMWMIANRLAPLMDIRASIHEDAKPILNSARLAYATNCVHVFAEKDYVVYEGEGGDRIKIYNLSVLEAFEILQGVFDYYQDWELRMEEDVRKGDFKDIIEQTEFIFRNPLLITDSNTKVLAMSRVDDLETMDSEWQYIARYGYSSLNSIYQIEYDELEPGNKEGCARFHWKQNVENANPFHGISKTLYFGGVECGRVSVVERNRKTNAGDVQLLQRLGQILQPYVGIQARRQEKPENPMYDYLFEQSWNQEALDRQLSRFGWTEDENFQIVLLDPVGMENGMDHAKAQNVIANAIMHNFPACLVLQKGPDVVILTNRNLYRDRVFQTFLVSFTEQNSIYSSFSLQVRGLENLRSLYKQASYAMQEGRRDKRLAEEDDLFRHLLRFTSYASRYIIEMPDWKDKICACHPAVVHFWELKVRKGKSEPFDTLKTFLESERSIQRTATEMYAHRNTITYRLGKIQSTLKEDLDDPAIRQYLLLSMMILEMQQEKNERK